MVISDRYKYLYFVIPKCGSASVRHALEPYTDIGYPVTNFPEHLTIEKFLKRHDPDDRFSRYFKFTFVRNPYDRLYSGFRQDVIASTRWSPWIEAKKPIFEDIGEDFNVYMNEYVAKADIERSWEWVCFCPMVAFSHKDGSFALDWVGRTESLDDDMAHLADTLGVTFDRIQKLNVRGGMPVPGEGPKYLGEYTRDTVALVNELYAEDFAAFDYAMLDPWDFPSTL